MKAFAVSLLVNVLLIAIIGALFIGELNTAKERQESNPQVGNINLGARNITFSDWELKTWLGIKNRLDVINTDPDFPDPNPENRVLGWYSMRNSSSGDYYQKSMEFLCFWEGQGVNGEWEAIVSIYNSPNSTTNFVVKVSRFTWHSLNVTLDGNVKASFPQVINDTISLGYSTFSVYI
jgi:hypothetical protein